MCDGTQSLPEGDRVDHEYEEVEGGDAETNGQTFECSLFLSSCQMGIIPTDKQYYNHIHAHSL